MLRLLSGAFALLQAPARWMWMLARDNRKCGDEVSAT